MTGGKVPNFDGLAAGRPAAKKVLTKDTPLLSWRDFNFERNNVDYKWLILISLILIGFMGYSVWKRDWFVIGITVVVAAVTMWYLKAVKPTEVDYSITPMGFFEGEKFYPFTEIHSFWMVYNQKVQKLFLAFDRKYLPALVVSVKNTDPVILRKILLQKIPEQTKRTESLVDRMIRVLGL